MSATITTFPGTSLASFTPDTSLASFTPGPSFAPINGDRPTRRHLRITRRGRAVLTVLVMIPVLAIVAFFMLNGGGAAASGDAGDVHFQHVTVAGGETLWQVAEDVAPKSDPRDVIADITSLNNLSTTEVQAGQRLAIPTEYTH